MRKILLPLFVCLILILSSCQNEFTEESFFCMDTLCTVKIDPSAPKNLAKKAEELLKELDSKLSRYNENSDVYAFNASKDGCDLSSDVKELVELGQSLNVKTDGCFSLFTGDLTSLWSESITFPTEDRLAVGVKSVADGAEFSGNYLKKQNSDTKLELGAIAKGYACDRAVEYLKNNGAKSGMVSFSSSIGVFGSNPKGQLWRIAVKNPLTADGVMGYVLLADGFLSVSGDYERFYEIDGERYNHILDPKSGLPVNNGVHSVLVVAPTGAESDALSTAFFVMGAEAVEAEYKDSADVKYLFVTDDGIFMNSSMSEIFTEENQ